MIFLKHLSRICQVNIYTMNTSRLTFSLARRLSSQSQPPKKPPTNVWKRKERAHEESYFQELQRKILEKMKGTKPSKK